MNKMFVQGWIFCSLTILLPALSSGDDGTRSLITRYLSEQDPVVEVADNHSLKTQAMQMLKAIEYGDWDNLLLRSPIGFDVVLYSYMNGMMDKDTFLDVQDYLQLQADYAAPETEAFNELLEKEQLPVRVPAVLVKRVRYSDLPVDQQPSMYKSPKARRYLDKLGWVTLVEIEPDFFRAQQLEFDMLSKQCDKFFAGDNFRCAGNSLKDKRTQMLIWEASVKSNLFELNEHTEPNDNFVLLILGNIPLFLHVIGTEVSPDFIPIYGSLNWDQLNELRAKGKNPGTIYHPHSDSNYLAPHGLYGGASGFVRHDLIHQKILGDVPDNLRQFLIWMHGQELQVIEQMDKAFKEVDPDVMDAEYNLSLLPPMNGSILDKVCPYYMLQIEYSELHKSRLPLINYWAYPGQHRDLFYGVYADMADFDIVKPSYYRAYLKKNPNKPAHHEHNFMGGSLVLMMKHQCLEAGFHFAESFRIYSSLMEQRLKSNEVFIMEHFGISTEELFITIEELWVNKCMKNK